MNIATLNLLAAALLAGCAAAVAPNQQQAAAADYGPYPSNFRQIIDAWIKATLKDPYSVRDLQVGEPEKFWITDPPLLGGTTRWFYGCRESCSRRNFTSIFVILHHLIGFRDILIRIADRGRILGR